MLAYAKVCMFNATNNHSPRNLEEKTKGEWNIVGVSEVSGRNPVAWLFSQSAPAFSKVVPYFGDQLLKFLEVLYRLII